jgi:hypothetical protein
MAMDWKEVDGRMNEARRDPMNQSAVGALADHMTKMVGEPYPFGGRGALMLHIHQSLQDQPELLSWLEEWASRQPDEGTT